VKSISFQKLAIDSLLASRHQVALRPICGADMLL